MLFGWLAKLVVGRWYESTRQRLTSRIRRTNRSASNPTTRENTRCDERSRVRRSPFASPASWRWPPVAATTHAGARRRPAPTRRAAADGTAATAATAARTTAAATTRADRTTGGAGGDASPGRRLPGHLVIQTDWNPEAEHGASTSCSAPTTTVDAKAKASVTGPLRRRGGDDTGVKLEVRSGGPAIGFQTVTAQMYTDDDILLGYVYTDEAIQNSAEFPTVAVDVAASRRTRR